MKLFSGLVLLNCVLISHLCSAADLKQSKFTQIVNDVKVLEIASKQQKAAAVNEIFKTPDILRTGTGSRVEMIAEDKTITRIGANSIFSFDPATRTIGLEEGSLLFHSPKGKGGGTIRTTSAAASVLGTTIIVATTTNGGFKVLSLEGKTKVKLPNGSSVTLHGGQMVFILPGSAQFSPVLQFNLEEQTTGSLLVHGFDNELPSMDAINLNILRQNRLIYAGKLTDTGLLIGDSATEDSVQVVDANVIQEYFESIRKEHLPPPPPPPPDEPIPPPAIVYDLIIAEVAQNDSHATHNPGIRSSLRGNNVQVIASAVDIMNFIDAPRFDIVANNILNFADNPLHSTVFFNSKSQIAAGLQQFEINELHLVAKTFTFPDNFSVTFNGFGGKGSGGFFINGTSDLSLSSTGETGLEFINNNGPLSVVAAGDMNVTGNVKFSANEVSFSANKNITMNGGQITSFFAGLNATDQISMKGTRLIGTDGMFVSMAARTLVFENVAFQNGTSVNLRCQTGQLAPNPNTGKAVRTGYVNFIRNVTYGGEPAQNRVGNGISISPL